jgi:hypothetical protein
MKNMTFTQPNSNLTQGDYGIVFYNGGFGFNIIMDSIVWDSCASGFNQTIYPTYFRLTNSTLRASYQEQDIYSAFGNSMFSLSVTPRELERASWDEILRYNQTVPRFENCLFEDNRRESGTRYGIYFLRYGTFILDSCEFKNANYGVRSSGATVYLRKPVFTTITQELYGITGWFLKAVYLNINVETEGGAIIDGANVIVEQMEGYERWQWWSDSTGYCRGPQGETLIVGAGEYTSTSISGGYTAWSDDIDNDKCHRISVFKEGYHPYVKRHEITTDTAFTITLLRDFGQDEY